MASQDLNNIYLTKKQIEILKILYAKNDWVPIEWEYSDYNHMQKQKLINLSPNVNGHGTHEMNISDLGKEWLSNRKEQIRKYNVKLSGGIFMGCIAAIGVIISIIK